MTIERLPCPLCGYRHAEFFFDDCKNFQQRYYRCMICDVVFVAPQYRLSEAEEKTRYDMHNNDYSEPYIDFLSRLATPMLAQLSLRSTGLDFGSGRSQAMAEIFRQAGHTCDCYDIFYYPDTVLRPRHYDFLVASEVIEHLYEPQTVIEQWLALLKPQGFLGIMTGLRPPEADFPDWWYKNDPTHVMLFSAATFTYLQKKHGLTLLFADKGIFVFRT